MKIVIILISLLFASVTYAADYVLYRISSGEVISISQDPNAYVDYFSNYHGVLTDPPFTDGKVIRDPNDELRVLGYAKINDNGTVRNATQPEIDTFAAARINDRNQEVVDKAKDYFLNHPNFRKIMIAFADIIRQEINILRNEHGLPDRSLDQVKTAILNRISKDD